MKGLEREKMENIIKRNNIMIKIYEKIECVNQEVIKMRLENIQLQQQLNNY